MRITKITDKGKERECVDNEKEAEKQYIHNYEDSEDKRWHGMIMTMTSWR